MALLQRLKVWRQLLKAVFQWYVWIPLSVIGIVHLVFTQLISNELQATIIDYFPKLQIDWSLERYVILGLLLLVVALLQQGSQIVLEQGSELDRARERKPRILVRPKNLNPILTFREASFGLDEKKEGALTFRLQNIGNEDAIDLTLSFSIVGLDVAEIVEQSQVIEHKSDEHGNTYVYTKLGAKGSSYEGFANVSQSDRHIDTLRMNDEVEVSLPPNLQRVLILYLQVESEKIETLEYLRRGESMAELKEMLDEKDPIVSRRYFNDQQRRKLIRLPEILITVSYSDLKGVNYENEHAVKSIALAMGGLSWVHREGDEDSSSKEIWLAMLSLTFECETNPADSQYEYYDSLLRGGTSRAGESDPERSLAASSWKQH